MSSEFDNAIREAYEKFWKRRDEIKRRQRQELEDATAQERRDLAAVMWSARRSPEKYSVKEIADLLGITNRNFLYSVLNDKPLIDPDPAKKPVGRPSSAEKPKQADTEKSAPFHLRADVSGRDVAVHNLTDGSIERWTLELDEAGRIVEIPEGWYADTLTPDEVQFYKDLIARVEDAHNG